MMKKSQSGPDFTDLLQYLAGDFVMKNQKKTGP
jgi:hypothetical protein